MKKAIITAGFGCSIKEVREKYIENIETAIQGAFPTVDCYRAFTSETIRKKIKSKENIDVDNMDICLERLHRENYTHVYISVSHIIPGWEYEKILRAADNRKNCFQEISVARPFLDAQMGETEVTAVRNYVLENIKEDEAIVLVGHGTDHSAHKYYGEFETLLKKQIPNLYLVNVEGGDFIEDGARRLKADGIRKVYLYPFMIVAGDHAINDIAADEDSIKAYLESMGFEAEAFIKGLGASEEVAAIFIKRLLEIWD